MKKRGISLSIETLIYFLIAIIVLFFLIWIFQDQASGFVSSVKGFLGLVNSTAPK